MFYNNIMFLIHIINIIFYLIHYIIKYNHLKHYVFIYITNRINYYINQLI